MSIGCRRIGNKSAGKRLHGNKPHIRLMTHFYQLLILFCSKIAKRKLKGFIKPALDGFFCNAKPVIGYSYMPNFSGTFCFKRSLIQPAVVFWLWAKRRIMELINVNIICLKQFKTFLQIFFHLLTSLCCCLSSNI